MTILRRKVLSIPILVVLTMDYTAAQTPDNVTSPTRSLAAASNGSPCEPFGVSASQQALSLCDLFRDAAVNANWERASDAANSLIQLVPDKGVGYFCAGYVALRRGQYLRAIRSLEAALDRASEVGVVHLNLALSYLGIQQHKLFETEVQWLIANRPRERLAYYYLAVYYTDFLKQPERAVDLFREALRYNSDDYLSHYRLGSFFEQRGKIKEAQTEYEMAQAVVVRLQASQGLPLEGLARLYLRQGNATEALRYARQAVGTDPKLASSRLLLGKILLQEGDALAAVSELKVAARLDETVATPHYLLARAYRKLAKPGESKQEQKLFLELKAVYGDE